MTDKERIFEFIQQGGKITPKEDWVSHNCDNINCRECVFWNRSAGFGCEATGTFTGIEGIFRKHPELFYCFLGQQ